MTKDPKSNQKPVVIAAAAASFLMLISGMGYRVLAARLAAPVDTTPIRPEALQQLSLKISDWTGEEVPLDKAIVQAKNYQLFVDYVYVALPLQRVYTVLRKKQHVFEKEGIGLLIINEKTCQVKKIIVPKQSTRKIISWQ